MRQSSVLGRLGTTRLPIEPEDFGHRYQQKAKVKHIRGGGGSGDLASKRKGIYMPDGSVWTGYYSDWETMAEKDISIVMETRQKHKANGGTPHKKKVPNLKSQIADQKRSIASLKKTSDDETEDSSDATDAPNNNGDPNKQKKGMTVCGRFFG